MTLSAEQILERAAEMTASYLGCHKEDLGRGTDLIEEFYMDSLDLIDLSMQIEVTFLVELPSDVSSQIRSLGDIVRIVEAAVTAQAAQAQQAQLEDAATEFMLHRPFLSSH